MPCDETSDVDGASCPNEIILGNAFHTHSGVDIADFLAENTEYLSVQ